MGSCLVLLKLIKEVFFIMLKVLLEALEERERQRLSLVCPGRYIKNGHQTQEKVIRTEGGIFRYHPQQLKDKKTGRTFLPLRECGFSTSAMTLHRRVQKMGERWIFQPTRPSPSLSVPDGRWDRFSTARKPGASFEKRGIPPTFSLNRRESPFSTDWGRGE